MDKKFYGGFFRVLRFIVRSLTPRYETYPSAASETPAVYIVHHQNLRGPVLSMAWLQKPLRLWVLSVFCHRKTCYDQYMHYTFTKRFGMPRILAAAAAAPLSVMIPALMRSMGAVPVYRGSRDIVKTISESIARLTNGESLLICTDIDYADTGSHMGEMHEGFLELEKFYLKQTGRHLAFVPIYISRTSHSIYLGETVSFSGCESFNQEKKAVYIRLKRGFAILEQQDALSGAAGRQAGDPMIGDQ
jgi:hypothetical protein